MKSAPDIVLSIEQIAANIDQNSMRRVMSQPEAAQYARRFMTAHSTISMRLDNSMSNDELDDILGQGDGLLAGLSQQLAAAYGVPRAILSLAGSSEVNKTSILALQILSAGGLRVLADRACHGSVMGGLALADANVVWLDSPCIDGIHLRPPVSPDRLRKALQDSGPFDAVVLTVPSYDGFFHMRSDLLREVCDQYGCRLILDGAWSANLGLLSPAGFPDSPARHAHACTISLHKKGIGQSGAAACLTTDAEFADAYCRAAVGIAAMSTSPAFVALSCLETALHAWLSPEGYRLAQEMIAQSENFSVEMAKLPGIKRIRPEMVGPDLVCDPSHVLFDVQASGLTGYELQQRLAEFQIDAEKATLTSLLFLTSAEYDNDVVAEIVAATHAILRGMGHRQEQPLSLPPLPPAGMQMMRLREAFFARPEQVSLTAAVGRIAAQAVATYPPGSPLIVPGEQIDQSAIDYLLAAEASGSRIRGVAGSIREVGLTVVATEPNHHRV